jgi:nicotinate dehydrogenase subunit A
MQVTTELQVNGGRRKVEADPDSSLLSVLRDELQLTGSKYGCGEGQCGACTVLLDGAAARSCVTTLRAAAGKQITTIEGLERDGKLHPLQETFLETGAMQCGYCIPGMIVAGAGFLRRNANPSRPEIAQALEGNVCRCGAHPRIVLAVEMAARRIREARR